MTTKKLNRSAKAEGQAPATLGDAPTSAKPTGTRDRRTSDKTSSAFRPASSSTEVRSIHPRTQKYGPPEATQEVQQQTAPTKPGIDTSTEHTPHKLDAYKTKITSEMHDASSQLLKELDNATSLEQSQQAASIPFMNNVRENPGEAPTESRFNASATLPDNGPRHDAGSKEGATASNPVKPSTVGVVTPARVSRAKGKASMSEEPLSQLASTSRKRKATKHVRKASAQVPKINRASTSQKPQQSNTLQHREVALPPYLSPLDLIRPILKFAAVAIITVACYLLFAFLAPFRFIFKIMMSIIAQIIVFIVFIDILWYSLCHSNASVGLLCRHSTPWSLSIPCSLPIIKAFTLCPAGIRSAEPGLVGPPVAVHEPPQLDVLLTGDGKGYEKLGQMAQKLMGLGPELPYHDEYLFQLRLLIRRKGIKNWQEIDTQILEIMAKNYALRRTLSSLNAKLETQAEFAGIFNEGAIGRLEEALRKPVKAPSVFNRLHETVIRWLPASKLAHRDRTKPATNRLADPVQKILQRHLEWKFRGIPETEALAEQASEILNAQNDRLLQISTLAANEEQEVSANQKALIAGRDPLTNILVRCISFEARDTDEFKEQLAALEHVQASYSRARDFVSIAQTGITDILNRQCQIKDTLRGLRRTDEEALQGGSGTMLRQYDEDDVITALRVLKGHIWKQEQSRVRLIKGVGGAWGVGSCLICKIHGNP